MRTPAGLSPEPSVAGAAGPAASPPQPAPADDKSALSAFDAFDELLADRSSGAPTRTTSSA
jgi:hypothetical protein